MRRAILALAIAALAACGKEAAAPGSAGETPAPGEPVIDASESDVPAGSYTLDKSHSTLIFRLNHIGFSQYTASFSDFDAELQLDPEKPEEASVAATVDVSSLELAAPPIGFRELLLGPDWLDAGTYPEITFRSTGVDMTGPHRATITGDLTLHGVTAPVTLDAKFNGGYAGHALEPNARIGFSATGSLKRSVFGVDEGLPPPGSNLGVGDNVEITIETEFTGPAWKGAASATE